MESETVYPLALLYNDNSFVELVSYRYPPRNIIIGCLEKKAILQGSKCIYVFQSSFKELQSDMKIIWNQTFLL